MKRSKGLWIRGDVIYFRFTDAQGGRQRPPTQFRVGQEAEALKALQALRRQVAAERELLQKAEAGAALPTDGVTVQAFGRYWNARRLKNEETQQAATEDRWKLEYIYQFLGHIHVVEFRTRHSHDFAEWLKKQEGRRGRLGKRTVRSVWSCLHNLFRYAVGRELIPVNPVVAAAKGEDGQLPEIEDKDPEWRDTAVFERWEVERLISDEAIPEWRRVLWAIKFLAGVRDSEAYALRISRYDTHLEPLGRLLVAKGWNTRHQKLKDTKTKKRRKVPVHPTLAKILARWLLGGWERHVGRKPRPDDLLIPSAEGEPLRVDTMLEEFRKDLVTLGLRADRQQYDTRRTFKSLSEDDGASPEKIRWVLWGRRGTVEDGYSAHAWAAFCAEVAKLRIQVLQGSVIQLKAAGAEIGTMKGTNHLAIAQFPNDSQSRHPDLNRRPTDYECVPQDNPRHPSTCKPSNYLGIDGGGSSRPPAVLARTVPLCQFDQVSAALSSALHSWTEAPDEEALRTSLASLLATLGNGGGR